MQAEIQGPRGREAARRAREAHRPEGHRARQLRRILPTEPEAGIIIKCLEARPAVQPRDQVALRGEHQAGRVLQGVQ